MTIDQPPTNIHEALSRAKLEIGVIGKDDENTFHHYAFRGIDAIVNTVGPVFARLGILTVPEHRLISSEEVTSSGQSTKGYRVLIETTWTFSIHVDDEESYIVAQTLGEAIDYSDKAVNQAQRQSEKNALIQVLEIPTGETDPDSVSPDSVIEQTEQTRGEKILAGLTAEGMNKTTARKYTKEAMANLELVGVDLEDADVPRIVDEALIIRDAAEAPLDKSDSDEPAEGYQ